MTVRLRRSVVLPAAVALAAVVAVPSSAGAAVQCGLVTPTKVVIDASYVGAPMRLTTACHANEVDHASWTLNHETGWGDTIAFSDLSWETGNGGFHLHPFDDDKDVGRFFLEPVEAKKADGTSLTQNSATILVKYGSRLAATVTRTSTGLRWAATASRWSTFSDEFRVRPGVTVGLFHQTSSTAAWTYVKSAKTSSTGKVSISLAAPKSGNYRLVVGETPDTWAAYTRTVKGRI